MTLDNFCATMGVIPPASFPLGRWVRCGTVDHPRSKNGAVKFMGRFAFVRNWELPDGTGTWFADGDSKEAQKNVREVVKQAAAEIERKARQAAIKAERILSECELAPHPYLERKGFSGELVNVWKRESDNVMVVPMRCGHAIVGAQLIKPDGEKKFLFGQRSGGAEFVIGQRGAQVLCEGYATALSTRQALHNLKATYTLHVCFSAGNMKRIAEGLQPGLVIADNDASGTGERTAKEIGWPYWISDQVGEDANDYTRRKGVFALAMGLKPLLQGRRRA
jgi:putative DNA primase/helicase